MKKILGYIFTPIHWLVFGSILVVFHPIQWLSLKLGGYTWHKQSVDVMNWFLMKSLLLIGVNCKFIHQVTIPDDRPLIIVSNHQSLFDIPPFFWYLRKHHVKFISKIELGKGIPSISFNLRHGGSALIDRKNPRQSIPAIKNFGKYIEENNYAACIFPEGTRSKDGHPKKFAVQGLKTLLKYIPSAIILPVTINDSWRLVQYGSYPLSFGEQPTWLVHEPIDPKGKEADELIETLEAIITSKIKN